MSSRGDRRAKFQEVLHAQDEYLFLVVEGRRKTDIFNEGRLNGSKHPILLSPDIESALDQATRTHASLLAVPAIKATVDTEFRFHGTLGLCHTYLLSVKEVSDFWSNYCMHCEFFGQARCYEKMACTEPEYDKYTDTVWRENRKEERKSRRSRRDA